MIYYEKDKSFNYHMQRKQNIVQSYIPAFVSKNSKILNYWVSLPYIIALVLILEEYEYGNSIDVILKLFTNQIVPSFTPMGKTVKTI